MLIKHSLLILFFVTTIHSIGNSCRQIIQEHYFDLSLLSSTTDYVAVYSGSTTINFAFNFCDYVQKKCSTNSPKYYLAEYYSSSCYYFRQAINTTSYALFENQTSNEIGLIINYENVNENGQTVQMKLICKSDLEKPTIGEVTLSQNQYSFTMYSKEICPQELDNLIYEFIDNFKWIIFGFGIVIGPLELLVGGKIFGITVFLLGFLLSAGFSLIFCNVFLMDSSTNKYWAYFLLTICLLISLFIGLILVKLKKLGIAVSGSAAGFFCCILLNYLIFWRINSQPSWLFFYNALILFTILGGIFGYEFKEHIIIISTSIIGSYITVRSLSLIFGGFPNELNLNMSLNSQTLTSFPWQFYIYFILIIVFFVLGMIFQFQRRSDDISDIVKNEKLVGLIARTNKKIIDHKFKYFIDFKIKFRLVN